MSTATLTRTESKTFTLAHRNDAGPVFALATFATRFLDSFDRYKVQCLRECEHARITRPWDEGSHPYDGAASDTLWALFDALDCVEGVEVTENPEVDSITVTIG